MMLLAPAAWAAFVPTGHEHGEEQDSVAWLRKAVFQQIGLDRFRNIKDVMRNRPAPPDRWHRAKPFRWEERRKKPPPRPPQ